MKTVFLIYLTSFTIGLSLISLVILSTHISKKYPNSKLDKFLKRHVVDNYEGDNF